MNGEISKFRIGDRIQRRSTHEVCEITGFIQAWPFGYFAIRFFDGRNSRVSIGSSRKSFRFISRPLITDGIAKKI